LSYINVERDENDTLLNMKNMLRKKGVDALPTRKLTFFSPAYPKLSKNRA
jgi:hypothetical protein